MALTEHQKALAAARNRRYRARTKQHEQICRVTAREHHFEFLEKSGLWRGTDEKDPAVEAALDAFLNQSVLEWLARYASRLLAGDSASNCSARSDPWR